MGERAEVRRKARARVQRCSSDEPYHSDKADLVVPTYPPTHLPTYPPTHLPTYSPTWVNKASNELKLRLLGIELVQPHEF